MTRRRIKHREKTIKGVGYKGLACAVVQQAVIDYKNADTSLMELIRIREFFKSKWFCCLCELDGERILTRLDKYRERKGYVDISVIIRNRIANGTYSNGLEHVGSARDKES